MAMCWPATECPPWAILRPRRFARSGASALSGGRAAAASRGALRPPRPNRAVWSRSGRPAPPNQSRDHKKPRRIWLAGESACPTRGTDAFVCQPGDPSECFIASKGARFYSLPPPIRQIPRNQIIVVLPRIALLPIHRRPRQIERFARRHVVQYVVRAVVVSLLHVSQRPVQFGPQYLVGVFFVASAVRVDLDKAPLGTPFHVDVGPHPGVHAARGDRRHRVNLRIL